MPITWASSRCQRSFFLPWNPPRPHRAAINGSYIQTNACCSVPSTISSTRPRSPPRARCPHCVQAVAAGIVHILPRTVLAWTEPTTVSRFHRKRCILQTPSQSFTARDPARGLITPHRLQCRPNDLERSSPWCFLSHLRHNVHVLIASSTPMNCRDLISPSTTFGDEIAPLSRAIVGWVMAACISQQHR